MSDEQDLVSEVAKLPLLPQNRFCADCDAEGPDWASLNLGILLCIKCAGVHRNLGVHLSKVRSLHLDTDCWDRNQLDYMLAMGNERAKEIYEANCPCWYLRPTADQDSSIVRENFIRAKYERKEFLADMPSVATSVMPEPPKEGYLWKANKKNTWQKRYTVLHGRFLNYFKAPSDSYPKGILDVCELQFKLPSGPDQNKRYVFEAHTSKRVYPFGAESLAEMIDWVHTLKRAAAYYITILGSDMADEAGMHMLTSSDKDIIKVSFQQLSSPAKIGFLSKQGGKWKSWNKRLCVVTDDTLFYFKKDKPSPSDLPEGGITLQNCYVSNGDAKAGKPFCISLMTPGRVFFLCATSETERDEWHKALKDVCDKKTPRRLVDFSQMDMPEPIRSQLDTNDDDSD